MAVGERQRLTRPGETVSVPARRETSRSFSHAEGMAAKILGMQQALGNQAVQQRASTCPAFPSACPTGGACHTCPMHMQTKPATNQPGDEYEQEADWVADRLTRPPGAHLQRRARGQIGPTPVPPIVHEVLRSPGQPLDATTRALMEPRFGHDFSAVRTHTDARASQSAQAVNALAYTVGSDVVFAAGQYAPATTAGQRGITHELAHVVQQAHMPSLVLQRQPASSSLPWPVCYEPGSAPELQPGYCNAREPANCPTYELWLNTFGRLPTFTARDTAPGREDPLRGSRVIGARATRTVDVESEDGEVPAGEEPPQPVGRRIADEFIDHPTDSWVRNCLPENLRQTAYQLPSDCADIAVILRHVWLSGHHRVESHGQGQIGDRAGGPRRSHVGAVIARVGSRNVAGMLNPYTGPDGRPLQSFAALQDLLHPGDVLVWAHHTGGLGTRRTGGHTQTITHIDRRYPSGAVTRIIVAQGNQPISPPSASEREAGVLGQTGEIQRYIREERGGRAPSETELRYSPGRRIEVRDLPLPVRQGRRTSAPRPQVWTMNYGHTTLVAAGPPASARRPAMRRVAGERIRRISDWFSGRGSALRNASRDRLHGVFEGALLETRAMAESGQTGLEGDARDLGHTAGERLWNLARRAGQSRAGDLAEETHFRPLQQMRAMIGAIGDPRLGGSSSSPTLQYVAVGTLFQSIDQAFISAARGASTLSFARHVRHGVSLIKVLVTGFDPFVDGGAVPPGVVNPSGAAALALDNTKVEEGNVAAAVEGVVLPVDFKDFRVGMVEQIVRPLVQSSQVDAVLTVSQDANIPTTGRLEIERYVVGVRREEGALRAIPAAPPGELGPAIIETPAPVEQIAAETERPAHGRSEAILRPTIGTNVTFLFASTTLANQALAALNLPPTTNREVEIADPTALQQIISTMSRHPNGTDITFQAGGRAYSATVLRGPGGHFLSNEVSYRVLRLLREEGRLDITSFHTHVPGIGAPIPQETRTPAERRARRRARTQAIQSAIDVRDRIISTLNRMILAVARRIAAARNPPGAPAP